MASLGQVFEVPDLPSSASYEPLPSGWYNATVTGAELRDTKSGSGQYIAVRYDITGPTHQGRVVYGNINIRNISTKAEEIGRQQLGELMRAIGLARVADTDELIGGQLQIKVDVRQQEGFAPTNEIRAYRVLSGGAPVAVSAPSSAAAPAPAPTQDAGGKAAPPWAKR